MHLACIVEALYIHLVKEVCPHFNFTFRVYAVGTNHGVLIKAFQGVPKVIEGVHCSSTVLYNL